jgi:hypothetical protein
LKQKKIQEEKSHFKTQSTQKKEYQPQNNLLVPKKQRSKLLDYLDGNINEEEKKI